MSSQTNSLPSNPITDPYQYLANLGIVFNSDGTITRDHDKFPNTPPTSDPSSPSPVLSKDITINQSNNTWARIYLPKKALDLSSSTHEKPKLPLLVYFHGGGFVLASAASEGFQGYCSNTANELPCVMVSIEYRLAPEHRLPAAYDDAMEALHWIKNADEVWLRDYADLHNVYLVGISAGGNMAYQVGLRAASEVDQLLPLKIKGLLLHQPYFGGVQRSQSELRLFNDSFLPVCATDLMWELSLPVGADRDHEYCNPTVGGGSEILEKIRALKWRVLVTGCDGDPVIDRQIEVVKLMQEKGMQVVSQFDEGGFHGVELLDPSKAKEILGLVMAIVTS